MPVHAATPSSPLVIRNVSAEDLPLILALNQGALPHVNSLELDHIKWFADNCAYFKTVDLSGEPVAFLGAMTPDSAYASPNFTWFKERYPSFVYIDRVVVAPQARRRGLGSLLYRDVERFTREQAPLLTCEVNLRPTNEPSLDFHLGRGFRHVGVQDTEGGAKTVALLAKDLTRN